MNFGNGIDTQRGNSMSQNANVVFSAHQYTPTQAPLAH